MQNVYGTLARFFRISAKMVELEAKYRQALIDEANLSEMSDRYLDDGGISCTQFSAIEDAYAAAKGVRVRARNLRDAYKDLNLNNSEYKKVIELMEQCEFEDFFPPAD